MATMLRAVSAPKKTGDRQSRSNILSDPFFDMFEVSYRKPEYRAVPAVGK
jgi:hypothetical protein